MNHNTLILFLLQLFKNNLKWDKIHFIFTFILSISWDPYHFIIGIVLILPVWCKLRFLNFWFNVFHYFWKCFPFFSYLFWNLNLFCLRCSSFCFVSFNYFILFLFMFSMSNFYWSVLGFTDFPGNAEPHNEPVRGIFHPAVLFAS